MILDDSVTRILMEVVDMAEADGYFNRTSIDKPSTKTDETKSENISDCSDDESLLKPKSQPEA